MIELTSLHFVYLIMVIVIFIIMMLRKDIVIPCILGIFIMGFIYSKSITSSISGIFNSFVVAGTELLGIIMVISCVTSLSKCLEEIGATSIFTKPFKKFMKSPLQSYWLIGFVMLIISWFFWPSPATAIIGAILVPVALRMGLPAIAIAASINLFGHGIALSTDIIIQGAPTITSSAAGVPVESILSNGWPLFLVMSVVTVSTSFFMIRRDMKNKILVPEVLEVEIKHKKISKWGKVSAILVPVSFLLDILGMFLFSLKGGDATALVGGTAVIDLLLICILEFKDKSLDKIVDYVKSGFVFGIEIFGPIIPIAAFFYMGELSPIQAVFGNSILPQSSQGILSDLGSYLANSVTLNGPSVSIVEMLVGCITGLDGSGFSGMTLAGSLAKVFGTAINGNTSLLAALGQIGAIWVGGGTLIPWSLIPAAAICGVKPGELARRNFIPVMLGLVATTITAMILLLL